jgi:hypothetical protein
MPEVIESPEPTAPGPAAEERQQLEQTVEMFETIATAQPLDIQSLEILREAYGKLGREADLNAATKRIAEAYVQMGQISSAILEYEMLLHRTNDPGARAAIAMIEGRAEAMHVPAPVAAVSSASLVGDDLDDGRTSMYGIFVENGELTHLDFDTCWGTPDLAVTPTAPVPPFVQVLADRSLLALEKSLSIVAAGSNTAFIPLERYDYDIELGRSFPQSACLRWCVLPFDRIGKTILVATCNPFNRQAALELEGATKSRLKWYLASPVELIKALQRVFRTNETPK